MADQLTMQRFSDAQVHNMSRWASASLLLFDVVMGLDQEIAFVWSSKWGLPKVLYVLMRYFGLAASFFACAVSTGGRSAEFCRFYNPLETFWLFIASALADALLLVRVTALFNSRPRMCLSLKAVYAAVYGVEFILLCAYVFKSVATPYENIGCISSGGDTPSQTPMLLSMATVPVLVFNTLLFSLTLFKILPYWEPTAAMRMPLLTLFVRDGSLYFAMLTSITAFITATPLALSYRPGLMYIGIPWFFAISPIAAGRLLLNLRGAFTNAASATTPHPPTLPVFKVSRADSNSDVDSTTTEEGGVDHLAAAWRSRDYT